MKRNTVAGYVLLALGMTFSAAAQTPEQRAKIVKHYDLEKINAMAAEEGEKNKAEKAEALRLAEINGWPVTITKEDGTFKELKKVVDGKPVYFSTFNSGSAQMLKVNRINSGGTANLNLNGQGMIVGVWDGGKVRNTHQDLTGRVTQQDGASTISNHATHVSGTVMGSGAGNSIARGMAYQATLWANDWNNDTGEMLSRAGQGLLISNHSYGVSAGDVPLWMLGAYNGDSWQWDNMTFNLPYYQPVVAAGNDRDLDPSANPSKAGRDLLVDQTTSKNVIVVAAAVQGATPGMSTFSSWGPTDDGRVKPDIAAKGVGVFSTGGSGDTSYESNQGTSMASPAIAGALLLLQQHYNNINDDFMRAATLRGIMIHTAADVEAAGPDHKFGWGIMNAEEGAAVITNNGETSFILETTLSSNQTYAKQVAASGTQPLKVTIAWTDRPGQTNTSQTVDLVTDVLVNDLDLRVTRVSDGAVFMPWRLNTQFAGGSAQRDDNSVDNVEKVELFTAEGQAYTPEVGELFNITVNHDGPLFGGTAQQFSIIISGIDENLSVNDKIASGFSIWPNPANDVLNISSDTVMDNLIVSIYDVQGREVMKKTLSNGSSADKLDISHLTSGMYIVEVNQGGLKSTKKLIKK